jgi:hypothetical protein
MRREGDNSGYAIASHPRREPDNPKIDEGASVAFAVISGLAYDAGYADCYRR